MQLNTDTTDFGGDEIPFGYIMSIEKVNAGNIASVYRVLYKGAMGKICSKTVYTYTGEPEPKVGDILAENLHSKDSSAHFAKCARD